MIRKTSFHFEYIQVLSCSLLTTVKSNAGLVKQRSECFYAELKAFFPQFQFI